MTYCFRFSHLLLASLIVIYLSETCDGQWCIVCQWDGWSGWSGCSGLCGGGRRRRKRNICCLPYPADWGNWCIGNCFKSHEPWEQYKGCTGSCQNGGTYSGGRCSCPDEYYSSSTCCRSVCPRINNCSARKCNNYWDVSCKTCEDKGSNKSYSIFWASPDKRQCFPTCSWKQQWCWPGTCSDSLASSCRCEVGFRKDSNSAICDILQKPDLLLCKGGIEDARNDVRNSTSLGNSSSCATETHTFVNIIPTNVSYKMTAHFEKKITSVKRNYINSTKLGIVNSRVEVSWVNTSGSKSVLVNETLRGGGGCSHVLSSTSPQTHLNCVGNIAINTSLENGDRICLQMFVSSGGNFNYTDFGGNYKGTHEFTPASESKEICFKYDNEPPAHCIAVSPSTCSEPGPLVLSTRVTTSSNITARVSGWFDPYPPHGRPDQASGVDFYNIHVYGVKHLDLKTLTIDYDRAVFSLEKIRGSDHKVTIVLPNQPEMYVTYLEVHDIAGNVRFSRRFLLYDNSSKVKVNKDKYLRAVSASKDAHFKWQIHHGNISLDWKDRYYNDLLNSTGYLFPIKADTGNSVVGVYEQLNGVLPVTGTESVHGVTGFSYQWSRNNGTKTTWRNVPDFTEQKMSLNVRLRDGETYEVWIRAQDIMVNTMVESVVVHIDRSVAEIADTWLVREGTSRIYVHNDTDLSKMVLQFRAFDVHSGIMSVQWALGTTNAASDIGTGALPVIKLDAEVNCSSDANCYCPYVGPCEHQNYTLTLKSLVAEKTDGKHNREYYFTLYITNGAMLKSFDHLDILVDESRPEVGTIQEGATGGPDIDYTSEKNVLVSWTGFIDHESGIKEYIVGLAERCLTVEDLKLNTSSNLISRTEHESVLFHFPKEGQFFSSVVALNQALEPSDVVCSDGINFDLSPPVIENVELHQATTTPSLLCNDNSVWLVNANLTMTELLSTQDCRDRCASSSPDNNLRFKIVTVGYIDNETADSFCRDLPFLSSSIMYIPSDRVILNWTISEHNSQIRDSYVGLGTDPSGIDSPDINDYDPAHGKTEYRFFRTGLGGGTEFFIFLKVENKAGLYSVVTLGPVLIDDTPPLVQETLTPLLAADHVIVAWMKGAFSDPEQQNNQFTVTFRALLGDQYVTPVIQTANSLRKSCSDDGYSDCVKYPLKSLQLQDSELGKPCSFELYVYNSAGHYTTVRTQPIYLPSRFPPGSATVIDLDPTSLDALVDVDFHRNYSVCFQWFGFHHHRDVSFEAGVGLEKGHDNVLSFQTITDLDKPYHCLSGTSLKPFTRYHVTIRANCSGGVSDSSSDGFVIVAELPDVIEVNNGPGCKPFESQLMEEIILSLKAGEKTEVTLNASLLVGFLYTAIIGDNLNRVEFDIQSKDIIEIKRIEFENNVELSFLPLMKLPSIYVSSKVNFNGTFQVYSCSPDAAYLSSDSTYELNWNIKQPYSLFMSSLKAQVIQKQSNCSNCQSVVEASTETGVEVTHFKFTNLNLLMGVEYSGSVSPCFDHICLQPTVSDGVYLAPKPTIGAIQSVVKNEDDSCTDLSIQIDGFNCWDNTSLPGNIQWTVLKGSTDVTPLLDWMPADASSGNKVKIDSCLTLPIHTYQKLFTCVRLFCPTGQTARRCMELMPNPYAESYSSHVLFELPSDDNRLTNVEDLLHSRYLGSSLKKFHELDVDFVNITSTISAVITNSAGRNITWYLMKDKAEVPLKDCDSSTLCVKFKRSSNGYIRFGWVKYEDSSQYFICAHVSSNKEEEGFKVCGNGFIVDNTPPTAGKIAVTTAVSGFITETTNMAITWSGFKDSLPNGFQHLSDGIKSYSIAIGNYPLQGNIQPWTSVGELTWFKADELRMSHGDTVYVSVQAEDHVGHVTTSVSSPLMVDLTPPQCGDINIEGLMQHRRYLSASYLNVHLRKFIDPESSIKSMRLFVLNAANTDEVTQRPLTAGTDFVNLDITDGFVDGHQYTVKVQVTNNAHLHSICKSGTFNLDNSPPHSGVIRDGNVENEVDYQTDTTRLECHWTGFSDAHSGIHEYRVGLGTSQNSHDVQPRHSVGLSSNFTFLGTFVPGVRYYTTVEACNQAGLCTRAWSDGVVMDASPPVAGRVLVGHSDTHHTYHGHRSYVYSHWVGFEDPETGIHHFEFCIGLSEAGCDVLNFTNTALSDSYFATGLHLPTSVPLFVAVRAYNPVGLMTESTSPSFQVDDTPPVAVQPPIFISTESDYTQDIAVQWENSLLYVAWKFEDDESSILEHVLTFRTHHESAVAIEKIKIGPVESHLLVLEKDNRLQDGDRYEVSITSCNTAGLCTTSHSRDILIDSTPPLIGGFKPSMTWATVNNHGSVSTTIHLTWYGFSDSESDISHYQISVGRTYEGAELTGGVIKVNHDNNTNEQSAQLEVKESLLSGESLILSIYAVNILGRPSSIGKVTVTVVSQASNTSGILEIQRHSCDIHYCENDCTCAVVGRKCSRPTKPLKCLDVSNSSSQDVLVFTGLQQKSQQVSSPSLSCITGHWDVSQDLMKNITRFEWSMGLNGENISVGIFHTTEESVWYDVGKRREVVHCLPHDRALESGEDYVVYVRAWYSDTDFSVSRSDSIRVDHTPPAVRRGRNVKDSDDSCEKDFDIFHANQSTIMACWGGLFKESQTRIAEYTVWAGVSKYGTDLLPRQSTGLATNITLPLEKISPGTRYFVGVRAVNTLNMSGTVISDGFLLDADPPTCGKVFNTINHRDGLAHSDDTSIGFSWHGFQDHHSSVRKYHVQIQDFESADEIANINVTLQNSLVLKDLNLTHSHSYIASVTAEDFAGHLSEPVLSKPIMIDTSAPTGFLCEEFVDISTLNITESTEVVGRDVVNEFLVTLPLNNSNHFRVQVWLRKGDVEHDTVHFEIGSLFVKSPFMQKENQSIYLSQYEFTLEPEVNGNILTITEFVRDSLDYVNITVLVCEQTKITTGPDAITTLQLLPSQISICARVQDLESGLKSVEIGVGTTRDGFQVKTLHHTVARFHELIDVDLPHGTPIFTTVVAENHAGLKSYFRSAPITLDHTPPYVSNLEVQLKYGKSDKEGIDEESVAVEASWRAEDEESELIGCRCSLGHRNHSSDIADWAPASSFKACHLPVPKQIHGQKIFLTVQCTNAVELATVATSDPLLISLNPPSSDGSTVQMVSQNRYSCHGDGTVQSDKSSLRFQWTWMNKQGVKHYQCRADGMGWTNTSVQYCEFLQLTLQDGETYKAQVRAVDLRERTSDVLTTEVTVDDSPPHLTGERAMTRRLGDSVLINHGGVFKHISGILTYTISVGSDVGYSDFLRQLKTRQQEVSVPLPASVNEVFMTIMATAPVGTSVLYTDSFKI